VILVVGLGNPGARYADSRHNVGAMVADELARRVGVSAWRSSFQGHFAMVGLGGERVGLLKPATFMNLSGRSVRPAVAFYKLELAQVLVVHDELDLPFGTLRLKSGGGDAGHHGLRSVTQQLGCGDYARLRFGIGHPPEDFAGSAADFVLEAFASVERAELPERVGAAADAVTLVVCRGLAAAMNATNQRTKR
jgi:PTH1 family peptidyl-tRNA hydrolase